ncbi:MAG: sporulation protein YqfD [Clostridia bacterium]|nr:sporulation protein YqfD [Clostridia bacterium]
MNLYRLIHLAFGECVFEINRRDFSRFATALSRNKLNIWGNISKSDSVLFCCSIFTAEEIINLAGEWNCELNLVSKRGLPFIFAKYRRRYGLMLGLVIGMLIMFAGQLFVWKITISGNQTVSDYEILCALKDCGVEVGSFIPSIDVSYESNELLMTCRSISSAAVSINGTHLQVSVLERKELPELIDRSGFYNVVASRDGIILDVDTINGTPEVSEGEAVFEGELLINSFIEGKNGSFRPTHASGIVYAAVNEHFSAEIPLNRVTKYYTGRSETKKSYKLLGRSLPSFFGLECDYEYFDAVSSEKIVYLFGFIELPIREFSVTYTEYTPIESEISKSVAEQIASEALSDRLYELGLEVLSCESEITFDEEKGVCIIKADAVLKQNIAKEVPYELINYKIDARFPSARE